MQRITSDGANIKHFVATTVAKPLASSPVDGRPGDEATKPYNESDTIYVESKELGYPDLKFQTICLSSESHPYSSEEKEYGGFILYGWNGGRGVKQDWNLNGKHCRGAYLVIQGIHSPGVQKCMEKRDPPPLGVVHGAVYCNVFGTEEDPRKAVGEGFSLQSGKYSWNSWTFNNGSTAYHDGKKHMAVLTAKCVELILIDWKHNSAYGKTYTVKELLSAIPMQSTVGKLSDYPRTCT